MTDQTKLDTGFKGNKFLKRVGEPVEFTIEQMDEYAKCSVDPVYFIENYAKIVSLDKGIVQFKLFPYQKRIIEAIHNNRKVIGKIGRQLGKCVSGDTEITIRNKKTGEILKITMEEFYALSEMNKSKDTVIEQCKNFLKN